MTSEKMRGLPVATAAPLGVSCSTARDGIEFKAAAQARQAATICRRFGLAPHLAAIVAAHIYGETRT